jgi:hypothetical protein
MKSTFEKYLDLDLSPEKRAAILKTKNQLLQERLAATGEVFCTELHEEILNQACREHGIIL